MATQLKNLSETNIKNNNLFKKAKIGIVVSEWNIEITNSLLQGACNFLMEKGVKEKNIHIKYVQVHLNFHWVLNGWHSKI